MDRITRAGITQQSGFFSAEFLKAFLITDDDRIHILSDHFIRNSDNGVLFMDNGSYMLMMCSQHNRCTHIASKANRDIRFKFINDPAGFTVTVHHQQQCPALVEDISCQSAGMQTLKGVTMGRYFTQTISQYPHSALLRHPPAPGQDRYDLRSLQWQSAFSCNHSLFFIIP